MTDVGNRPERIYQRGLLPFDPEKHARFATTESLGFALTPPSYPIDKSEGITDWGMDGNGPDPTLTVNGGNPVGDCGPSAVPSHSNMLTAVLAGLALSNYTMTSDQVVDLYFEYTGGQDTGVDLGDWLLWLFQKGLIEGFVAVPLSDLDAALQTFDVVLVGVNLNPQADQQFPNGWDVGPGDEPDPEDGHAILYLKAQTAEGPFGWCSWGAVATSTLAWKNACPTQAFAVTTAAEAAAKGFVSQFEALQAGLRALGGTVAPTPAPPTPTPTPTPGVPNYEKDSVACRIQLAKALTVMKQTRQALNKANAEPTLTPEQHEILASLDGPLRIEDTELETFLEAPLPA